MDSILTHEYLLSVLEYNKTTGEFKRIKARNPVWNGKPAGTIRPDGYMHIGIGPKVYFAHRLAWFYVNGEWPRHTIDHINGVRTDNRISNLRDVPVVVNCENNHTAKGVRVYSNNRRYQAIIGKDGKQINLGSFGSFQEARDAYVSAKRLIHAGCTI